MNAKPIILCAAVLLLISSAWGIETAHLVDGFYRLDAQGKPGVKVVADSKRATLISRDNLNQHFYLSITLPFEKEEQPPMVLLLDNVQILSRSKGATESVETSYGFELTQEQAQSVEASLQIKRGARSHPGYLFTTVFQSSKEKYKAGEEVRMKVTIWNVGSKPFALMAGGRNRGARDNQFSFTLFKNGMEAVPDTGSPRHFGGMAGRMIVKPNEKFEKEVDLSKWFKLEQAGTYFGTGSYYFEVVPVEGNMMSIWEDYATGEFSFTIEGK